MTLSFPPFTRAVKIIIIINVAIFFFLLIGNLVVSGLQSIAVGWFGLIPGFVTHGFIWQLVTYAFLHAGILHILFNMLGLWMFGSQFEMDWGSKQFVEFYLFCVIGAALVTVAVSYTGFMGVTPLIPTVGASGGIYGILMAYGMLYGNREVFMFPLPFMIKAKYMVGIIILLLLASTLTPGPTGVANFAHLGGLIFGFLYVKFLPRRGLQYAASEQFYGARNWYQRWKRRRAARKFEVYMRKHDRAEFFDEYGNYKPPDKKDGESGRGPWVN
jgi:membrane associated rhomboid family serine protease